MLTVISPPMEHVDRPACGTPFLRGVVLPLITDLRVELFVHLFVKVIKVVKNALFTTPFDDPLSTHSMARTTPPTPPTLLVTGQSETDLTGIDGDERRI